MLFRLCRAVCSLAVFAFLAAAPALVAVADDEEEEGEEVEEAKAPKCVCAQRDACWHFLHAPSEAPGDPCSCTKCDQVSKHDGKTCPDGWNPLCFTSNRVGCFLKRHAASWKITCSECVENVKCCDAPHKERCPACADGDAKDPFKIDAFGKDPKKEIAERVAFEMKTFDHGKPVVAYSKRFYVVTDIARMQIKTQSGGFRWVETHEMAHVMLERAEKAFRDFSVAFRGRVSLLRPMGVFLPQRDTTSEKLRERYFRNKNAPMIYSSYAGRGESNISDGFCLNGLCISLQQAGNDDIGLHQAVRHLMGNILVTCWIKRSGDNEMMPRWVFEGAAHWLGKSHRFLKDKVWYCIGEEGNVSGSGKDWMNSLAIKAAKNDFPPIDEFLSKSTLGRLTYEDHKRAWGYFEICMAEWREPWIDFLAELRRGTNVHDAFKQHLECTPQEFHDRWVERMTGRRKTILPTRADEKRPDAEVTFDVGPGDKPEDVTVKIQSLGVVTDPAIVRKLVDAIGSFESDLVRESAMTALRRVVEPEALKAIHEHGLTHQGRFARAYSARLCRKLRLKDAKEALRKLASDGFWLAKGEAALALGAIRDFDSQALLRELVAESSGKVRIAAMDALTFFGLERNDLCVLPIAKNVSHSDWQVRLAACQVLRVIGDEQAIDALIACMEAEAGRIHDEALEALRDISGEDLGKKPEHWKKWWERESGRVKERGGFDPKPKASKHDERYAKQPGAAAEYYGVQLFSQRIGFVLDVSRSTNRKFNPDANTKGLLHGKYENNTIFEICREEVALSAAALDSRAMFNVIAFGTDVRRMSKSLVQANESNKKGAGTFVRSHSADGETNFYGALTAALDIEDGGVATSDFRDTPDTMVFLTDGTPTRGEITDPETLLEWYTEANRYARIRTHTFAFGQLEVDEELLRKMALQNWGRFTQLYESN